jgi:hypothetical protein
MLKVQTSTNAQFFQRKPCSVYLINRFKLITIWKRHLRKWRNSLLESIQLARRMGRGRGRPLGDPNRFYPLYSTLYPCTLPLSTLAATSTGRSLSLFCHVCDIFVSFRIVLYLGYNFYNASRLDFVSKSTNFCSLLEGSRSYHGTQFLTVLTLLYMFL